MSSAVQTPRQDGRAGGQARPPLWPTTGPRCPGKQPPETHPSDAGRHIPQPLWVSARGPWEITQLGQDRREEGSRGRAERAGGTLRCGPCKGTAAGSSPGGAGPGRRPHPSRPMLPVGPGGGDTPGDRAVFAPADLTGASNSPVRRQREGTCPSAGCPRLALASLPGQPRASHSDSPAPCSPQRPRCSAVPGPLPRSPVRNSRDSDGAVGGFRPRLPASLPAWQRSPSGRGLYFVCPTVLYLGVRNGHLLRDTTQVSARRLSVVPFLMPFGLPGPLSTTTLALPSSLTHPDILAHLPPGGRPPLARGFSQGSPSTRSRLLQVPRLLGVLPPTRPLPAHVLAVGVALHRHCGAFPCARSCILQTLPGPPGAQGCLFRSRGYSLPLGRCLPQSGHSVSIRGIVHHDPCPLHLPVPGTEGPCSAPGRTRQRDGASAETETLKGTLAVGFSAASAWRRGLGASLPTLLTEKSCACNHRAGAQGRLSDCGRRPEDSGRDKESSPILPSRSKKHIRKGQRKRSHQDPREGEPPSAGPLG